MICRFKEIFSSIQGEGIYLGYKQLFIRFNGCNMKCSYCDEKLKPVKYSLSAKELYKKILSLEKSSGPHHSISLTGGEPLLSVKFLAEFLHLLKPSFIVYLETNGTLPGNLKKIIEYFDIIAMDIKLPSSTGNRQYWKEHEEFLKTALKKKVFIKVIVHGKTTEKDIKKAVSIVRKYSSTIPFIIQPVFGMKLTDKISGFYDIAKAKLDDVRIIPQVHKLTGVK